MPRHYLTTAIDYPNAAPHLGHVLEKVLADVLARWFRLQGHDVRFQIGTDEHGVKIQRRAQQEGMTPAELTDRNVRLFTDLYRQLNISADCFVRTSDRAVDWLAGACAPHRPTVEALWKRLRQAGMLEKRSYSGLYCPGCERFVTQKDLIDGLCPDHNRAPDEVTEDNWFFLLSKETAWLKELLRDGYRIIPGYRSEETLALLERGLDDVSFSRPTSSLSWGIPVPGDEEQTMYVWCDALTNYLSGLGYFTDAAQTEWWEESEVTHVIGKDIARFHALIWPVMLKHAGLPVPPPHRLLMHGFVTNEGRKMSKSLGNVVNPADVLEKFGGNPDPLRFFLCHEIPVGRDGDFSWKRLEEMYDAKLRNKIGNVLNRVLTMLHKLDGTLAISADATFLQGDDAWARYEAAMQAFDPWNAVHLAMEWAEACDKYMNDQAPWKAQSDAERRRILSILAENIRHITLMLLPFIPDTAQRMSLQLSVPHAERLLQKDFVISEEMKQWNGQKDWKNIGEPSILFPPLVEAALR